MLALLDSGEGGRITLSLLRRFIKEEDAVLLMDKENCPYGQRSRRELLSIITERLTLLRDMGARLLILGCCTASAIYGELPEELRSMTLPIIMPTARRAIALSENGRIAMLATEATVRSGAFERYADCLSFTALPAPGLVEAVEGGEWDGGHSEKTEGYLEGLIDKLALRGADTLILGCTHFHALEKTAARICRARGIGSVVSSAREGALHALAHVGKEISEEGRDIILTTPLKK